MFFSTPTWSVYYTRGDLKASSTNSSSCHRMTMPGYIIMVEWHSLCSFTQLGSAYCILAGKVNPNCRQSYRKEAAGGCVPVTGGELQWTLDCAHVMGLNGKQSSEQWKRRHYWNSECWFQSSGSESRIGFSSSSFEGWHWQMEPDHLFKCQ